MILVSCSSQSIPFTSTPVSIEDEIKQLLQDNNCKPPCFLSVVPEQTTEDELRNIFIRYGVPLQKNSYPYGFNTPRYPTPEQLIPYTNFFIRNEKVHSIQIFVDQSNEFLWSLYSPTHIMRQLGTPSRVIFGMQFKGEPTPTKGWYLMTFFYDDLDFMIQYGLPEVKLGELISICPNKEELTTSALWLGKDPEFLPLNAHDVSLEEVTSFTLESFRDYMLGPDACFDLKGKAFQSH